MVKREISNITNLATNTSLNSKINEVKGELPNIPNLAATAALTTVENEMPSVSNLTDIQKKYDYNTEINEIEIKITDHTHNRRIITPEFSKFTKELFDLRLKKANLPSKSNIANFVNKIDFDNKLEDVTPNKNELNEQSAKIKATSTKG